MLPLVIMPNMEQIAQPISTHMKEKIFKTDELPSSEIYNVRPGPKDLPKDTLNLVLFTDTSKVVNYT
jgi:hypothetical protein